MIMTAKPESVPFYWPWLRRSRECPEKADEKEVRELRLSLSPLKLVEKSRQNPRAYRCPQCGGTPFAASILAPVWCWHP